MKPSAQKWVSALSKINKLTQDGVLRWAIQSPPSLMREGTDSKIDLVYVVTFKETNLRLYEVRYLAYDDYESSYWAKKPVLEVVDDLGRTLWTFPASRSIYDLFEAVQYQTAGVNQLLDKFLDSEGTPAGEIGSTS